MVRTEVPGVGTFWNFPQITVSTGNVDITISAFGKEDHFLTLNFGATNTSGVPKTFHFTAGIPIGLPAGANVVQSPLGGTMTDPFNDGVTVSPVGSTILTSFLNGTSMGVDVGTSITSAGLHSQWTERKDLYPLIPRFHGFSGGVVEGGSRAGCRRSGQHHS